MLAAAAMVLLIGSPAVAGVDDGGDDAYPPSPPSQPALNASAYAACVRDAPWISYDVTLIDPEGEAATRDVTMVFSKGGQRHETALGALDENGRLAGAVLWPAAAVDAAGNGAGWPGWELQDGVWRDVGDANLGWTREGTTVTIETNPAARVSVAYPPSTPGCVLGPRQGARDAEPAAAPGGLAATGTEIAAPLLVGAALLAAGVAAVSGRRRRPRS